MEEKEMYTLNGNFYIVDTFNSKEKDIYYFANNETYEKSDEVVVETPFGIEYGIVTTDTKVSEVVGNVNDARKIIRKATEEDKKNHEEIKKLQISSLPLIKELIENLKLEMKVVEVRFTLDKSKVLITYVSEDRVDFRNLLKELASNLKCRIELRQIGSRDRSAAIGGIGACGLPICCSSFLKEFDGISINMAKNQMLALNIQKLSGHCGKLLCCLKYEDQLYTEAKKGIEKIGFRVTYNNKNYKVTNINYVSGVVKLENEDGAEYITTDILRELKRNV